MARSAALGFFIACALGAGIAACGPRAVSDGESAPVVVESASTAPLVPAAPPPWTARERSELAARLRAIFDHGVFGRGGAVAVVGADGAPLFEQRGDRAMTPASTLKLLVAATALDVLGPEHHFETSFMALAPPDMSGDIAGPLWFVGGGDPLFTSNDLRDGVGVLRRLGIHHIRGPLLIDDRAFNGAEQNARWAPEDLDEGYASATSAISLDQDTVEFHVTPGIPGGLARVTFDPPNRNVDVKGSIETGYVTDLRIERRPDIVTNPGMTYRNVFTLSGTVATGPMQKVWKPVLGLPAYVAGAIAALLQQAGIEATARRAIEPAPLTAQRLWLHRSAPLSGIVEEMLFHSNNHSAEQLLRAVGERAAHVGTDQAGLLVERDELTRLGLARSEFVAYDGSGLAPSDKIAARTLAQLLAAELRGPNRDVLLRALPRVGLDGTVIYHVLHRALGRARAKSGHLSGVNGLAGTVETDRHGHVAFAFIVNDPDAESASVEEAQDRALDTLADF